LAHALQEPCQAYLSWRASWIARGFESDVRDLERTAAWNLLQEESAPVDVLEDDLRRLEGLEAERIKVLDHAERAEASAWSRLINACRDPAVPAEDKADLADDYECSSLVARDAQARLSNVLAKRVEASRNAERARLVREVGKDWLEDARAVGLDAIRRERDPYERQLACLERLVKSVPALRDLRRRMSADDRVVLRWSRRLTAAPSSGV
jgi:hypothetical protein